MWVTIQFFMKNSSFLVYSMSWEGYLEQIGEPADGSAILTLTGNEHAVKGNWKATNDEEVIISKIFLKPNEFSSKDINYNGKKFYIVRDEEDIIVAQGQNEGIILQKSKTAIIGAHFNGNFTTAGNVCEDLDKIVQKLKKSNY